MRLSVICQLSISDLSAEGRSEVSELPLRCRVRVLRISVSHSGKPRDSAEIDVGSGERRPLTCVNVMKRLALRTLRVRV